MKYGISAPYSLNERYEDMPAPIELHDQMTILFQGDSITDAGRNGATPGGLGYGYAYMVASRLWATLPGRNLHFVNRGVSGNRVRDLRSRWKRDCLDVEPDLVSILVGVNEAWRRFDCNDPTTPQRFRDDYTSILQQLKDDGVANIVLCEPFLLPYPEERIEWRDDLEEKLEVVRGLARQFDTILVPFDTLFQSTLDTVPPRHWAEDGVHPTPAGHALMADCWITSVVKMV